MSEVKIYTTNYCGYCHRAKAILESKGVAYTETSADGNPELRAELFSRTGSRTVPQIWIGPEYVGGCTELMQLDASGRLDEMLAIESGR